jgi:putative membrane protein
VSSEREPDARFTLANERTFLAYTRTGLALIGGGVALGQLRGLGRVGQLLVSLPPVLLGIAVVIGGHARWRAVERALRQGLPLPESFAPRIVAGVVALGLVAAAVIVAEALT